MYAAAPDTATPTPPEIRKLTGKAAELAALLCRLPPDHRYVEPHPGGGALGVRLDRFDLLPRLIEALSPRAVSGTV